MEFDVLFALLVALAVSAVFWAVAGWPGAGSEAIGLFLLALLVVWAAGVWITPVGPTIGDDYWLPFIIPGLLFLLLLAALVPPRRPRNRREAVEETTAEDTVAVAAALTLGVIFWVLIVFLIIAIIAAYA
ncbi:MAG TPA: hypothetical protein VGR16_01210 [Thermomicrobiales bacterium]|nr:hypothetical protein [Thermomicrobiales bacterium]